tara:strand:- start:492 stop:839 length:348 start_codon:yes stop_codon:yes gene_type:complete
MQTTKLYQAIACDYHFFYVICPNQSCREHIHKYDSNLNIKNRNEIVKSICKMDHEKNVCVRIDETTSRVTLTYYPNKSITISKRKFMSQQREYEPDFVPEGKIKVRTGNFVIKFN